MIVFKPLQCLSLHSTGIGYCTNDAKKKPQAHQFKI